MDQNEEWLRERLRRAASELEEATHPGSPVRRAIDRGLRARRVRRLSLAGSGVALAALIVFLAVELLPPRPAGVRIVTPAGEGAPAVPADATPAPEETPEPRETTGAAPQPSPSPTTTGPSPSPPPAVGPCDPLRAIAPPPGIEVTLRLDKTVVLRAEPVPMTIRVRNTGSLPVTHWRPSGQRYDFWVEGPEGAIWLWSAGMFFTQALVQETFAPGEERTAAETWDQSRCSEGGLLVGPPPPGRYVARALWTHYDDVSGSGGWWSNPVEFEIR